MTLVNAWSTAIGTKGEVDRLHKNQQPALSTPGDRQCGQGHSSREESSRRRKTTRTEPCDYRGWTGSARAGRGPFGGSEWEGASSSMQLCSLSSSCRASCLEDRQPDVVECLNVVGNWLASGKTKRQRPQAKAAGNGSMGIVRAYKAGAGRFYWLFSHAIAHSASL